MSKKIKISLLILLNLILIITILLSWYFITTKDAILDKNLLVSNGSKIVFLDTNGRNYSSEIGDEEKVPLEKIPTHVKNAFIAVEDKRYYKHNGIDKIGLTRALFNNLKSFSFKEGGSTISQQLIKNTHLSSEKTIKRKMKEYKLVKQLEKNYSKNEILEIYLNTIYFGEGCYGIAEASSCYFNKSVNNLSISEGALLAGLIKAPSSYSPFKNLNNCVKRRNLVLSLMEKENFIDKNQYSKAVEENITLNSNYKDNLSYNYLAKKELSSVIDKMPYKSRVFYVKTYYDKDINEAIIQTFNNKIKDVDSTMIVTNSKGKILGYKSSFGEIKRQPGSTLKPLAVYLPAIETEKYDSCSIIKDEKICINGYSPKNYNDKYYGNISMKQSLSVSSNVCAVKIMNDVGVETSLNYVKKLGLELDEKDKNLSLALGATTNGVKFSNLVGAYNIFCNDGYYHTPTCISEILNDENKVIYKDRNIFTRIYSSESTEIVREMLKETVKTGTAKKLSNCNFPLYAKTGTVGDKNGNTDAYTISFNKDYVIGVWLGGKKITNSITGGGLPCNYSYNIWNNIYMNSIPPNEFEIKNAKKIFIDKDEYSKNNIVIADPLAPECEKQEELFRSKRVPITQSTKYFMPEIEIPKLSVISNGISIRLCLPYSLNARIFRSDGEYKYMICDTKNLIDKSNYIDKNISSNKIYQYSIIPYYQYNDQTYYGKEIFLNKIKSPIYYIDDDDWID